MTHPQRFLTASAFVGLLVLAPTAHRPRAPLTPQRPSPSNLVLTGQAAFTDAAHEAPGIRRHLTVADLPEPAPDQSVDNGPNVVPRPANAWPIAPKGFKVELYATGLDNPRLHSLRAQRRPLPRRKRDRQNQDLSRRRAQGQAQTNLRLRQPASISPSASPSIPSARPAVGLHRRHRRHRALPLSQRRPQGAAAPCEHLADLPGGGRLRGGGHWTRDLVFSLDGAKLFASVGSHSNVDDSDTHPEEFHRADVLEFTPEGKFLEIYAWGLRNCVGEAINPTTGELWCSTNERDALGNNLVPDYITHVQEGGFYGWPWWYMGVAAASGPAP